MPGRAPIGVPITTLRLRPVSEEGSRQYYRNLEAREVRNRNIIKNENDPRNIGGTGGRSTRVSSSAQDSAETQRLRARQNREKQDANRNDPRNTGGNRKSSAPSVSVSAPKYDKATKFAIGLTQMGQTVRDYKKLNSIKASSPPKAAEKVKTDGSALSSMKEDMKTSAKVVRGDRDYMGEAFDASLRRGVGKGRDYLKSQLAKDNVSDKKQQEILGRFQAKFANDEALTSNKDGLVAGYEKGGEAKKLLDAYRKRGGYRKGATATEIANIARGK
jgi:hypothetical protein